MTTASSLPCTAFAASVILPSLIVAFFVMDRVVPEAARELPEARVSFFGSFAESPPFTTVFSMILDIVVTSLISYRDVFPAFSRYQEASA